MTTEIKREFKLEIVHVLFLDIVGYSKALTDEQQELVDRLNRAVRGSVSAHSFLTEGNEVKEGL